MRWDSIGVSIKYKKGMLGVYSNSTSPKKMWCLQAFFFLVLGDQLSFNGKISYVWQKRINHIMGYLIFFLKMHQVLSVMI